ncbi:phosphoserine phosphatase SerB [Litorimonas cladophorae]|uniref:Phosphoserine phosphatase n=1 Tax=Litorimonas cladophorae TaxID=1220491 RepID=A0A918KH24_9PROT|nr:phosphoserine phosphatase SerB [Litorimonas cladophorae]GGX60603.1 phosphoserine phosphatase SerB [Litorimonas cladophorae]
MSAPSIDTITTLVLKKRNPEQLQAAQAALGMAEIKTLAEGLAIEGKTNFSDSHAAAEILNTANIQADVSISKSQNRRKSLLICDMDSTLIGEECIDELADFAGVKARVSAITERAMRGEIGFNGALQERVALLKGLPLETLQTCFEERIHINPGAKTLCATMKAAGAKTLIVSGGFTFFSQRVAEATGFEDHQANILLNDGKNLLGTVADPILGREAKLDALKANVGNPLDAVAVGDGANDLAMVTAAGLGVAYYAKPAVAAAAQSAIRFTDLRTVLYFQGFSEDEFVEVG